MPSRRQLFAYIAAIPFVARILRQRGRSDHQMVPGQVFAMDVVYRVTPTTLPDGAIVYLASVYDPERDSGGNN
jgi:hypothetical protein